MKIACLVLGSVFSLAGLSSAQVIQNPGFETDFTAWAIAEDARADVAISGEGASGEASAKIEGAAGQIAQTVSLTSQRHYQLSVQVKGAGLVGVKVGDRIYFERVSRARRWKTVTVKFNSDTQSNAAIFLAHNGATGRFDDVELTAYGAQDNRPLSPHVVTKSSGGTGLSPDLPPGANFELIDWNLSIPVDEDGDGRADTISETDLAGGASDPRFFYTGSDGGLVMRAPVAGARTSNNTRFTRTELREMLRRGDTDIRTKLDSGVPNANNWVFSSAPDSARAKAGAVDGSLHVSLAVNHVTTTGVPREIGRVIIGQIHAKDDEPIRLYYRKLPGHERGSIYAAHESKGEPDDIFFDLIGDRSDDAEDPPDGIALGEVFSYRIHVVGNVLEVAIIQDGEIRAGKTINMSGSGYDIADDYMYFKVGVYNQNRSGDPDDYVQATFYQIENSH